MKYKVHWLIDGLIEVEAVDTETAEKLIKEKVIRLLIVTNKTYFDVERLKL